MREVAHHPGQLTTLRPAARALVGASIIVLLGWGIGASGAPGATFAALFDWALQAASPWVG